MIKSSLLKNVIHYILILLNLIDNLSLTYKDLYV